MSSVATLEALAPQYVDDARVETYLELAATLHTPSAWGNAYAAAMAFYAAHCLTMADREGAGSAGSGGAVTARSAGDLAESYANTAAQGNGDDWLRETTYGRQYLHIRATRAAGTPQLIRLGATG